MEKRVQFISVDGKYFQDEQSCIDHESKIKEFHSIVQSKIGAFEPNELRLGGSRGEAVLKSIPFTAPWMSAFGSCLIGISDIRRNESGVVEFQLAGEDGVPYENGEVWVASEAFYSEWPQ